MQELKVEIYSFQNSILSVHHYSSPATNIKKYRWQNDCWRLIGEDRQFNFRGYNPNNERIGISINHLTGRAIYTFEEGVPINRTFDPEVWCFGDGNYSSDINFHDGKALDWVILVRSEEGYRQYTNVRYIHGFQDLSRLLSFHLVVSRIAQSYRPTPWSKLS